MRFVIKAVFWFAVVLLFLPEDTKHRDEQSAAAPVDAELTTSSVKTSDLVTQLYRLCTQNPEPCEKAGKSLSAIDLDTENGVRFALELLSNATERPVPRSSN
jgi:hypothetical protein